MRRVLTGTASYLDGLARAVARGWSAFFFSAADPTPLGLIRVAVGLLAFWNLLVYGLDLGDFFRSDGWASPDAVLKVQGWEAPYPWWFWFHVPDAMIRPVWCACLLVVGLFTVGLFSRVTAVLAWVVIVATVRRVPVSLYGFDQALSSWALYLAATGASGQSVSLDRFFARWKQAKGESARRRDGRWTLPAGVPAPSVSANLALRLIQLHLCLVYGMAGLAKLQGVGWWSGSAVWGTLAAGEFRLFDLTWMAAYPSLIHLATHLSLAAEVGYPVLVWVRVLRPALLALVVAMHAGVELTLGLGEFGLAMVAGNLAFASGPWLRSLVTGREAGRAGPDLRVLYDGACPKCRATMAVFSAADPGGLVEPIDLTAVDVAAVHPSLTRDACLKAMHAVRADGRVFAGYDAVAAVARRLPVFWPLAVPGSVPPVPALGRPVYNAIAERRAREGPCNDETCALHPSPTSRAGSRSAT